MTKTTTEQNQNINKSKLQNRYTQLVINLLKLTSRIILVVLFYWQYYILFYYMVSISIINCYILFNDFLEYSVCFHQIPNT